MKRKINIDRPHLSSKEIASRQDFSSLMKQLPKVTKPPFYKTGWFITTVASVAGIAVITTNFILNDKTPTLNQELAASANTEAPNTSNIVVEEHKTEETSPPVILVSNDEEELPVEHEAILNNETEKASPKSNSQAIEQQLEMLKAEMAAAKAVYNEASNSRMAFEMQAPEKPISEGDPSKQFVLDIDPNEFPELSDYKNLLFEAEPSDPNFSPSVYNEEWEDIKLQTKGNTYYLSLYKEDQTKTFAVFPIYKGSDYEIALSKYEKEYEKYSSTLKKRMALELELKSDYDQIKKKYDQLNNSENNLSKTD